MTNEEKKYTEALEKAAIKYQKKIEANNPQAEAWDFYGAFIAGAIWRDKRIAKEQNAFVFAYSDELITVLQQYSHSQFVCESKLRF